MNTDILQTIARIAANGLAGWLAKHGLADAQVPQVESALSTVAAAAIPVATFFWSRWHQKRLLNTPAPVQTAQSTTTTTS